MFEKGTNWSPAKVKQKQDDEGKVKGWTASSSSLLLHQHQHQRWSWRQRLQVGALVVALLALYYGYLTSMYMVDEVYDGDGPRELEVVEKFTIRVAADGASSTALGKFVSKYSLCQHVEEVQILWVSAEPAPTPTSFVYAHTHSRVTIQAFPPSAGGATTQGREHRAAAAMFPPTTTSSTLPTVSTEAVLLLDLHAQVDCLDLAFAHGVWRSSRQTLIGLFPWLHQRTKSPSISYQVYDWKWVWWNQAYSLMHPAGVFPHKGLLERLGEHAGARNLISKKPECFEFALSVLSAKEKPASAPIWANVPARCDSCFGTLSGRGSTTSRGECLTALAAALQIEELPYSVHKSSRANTFLTWSL